jgi:hypothetical protein
MREFLVLIIRKYPQFSNFVYEDFLIFITARSWLQAQQCGQASKQTRVDEKREREKLDLISQGI